MDDTSASIQAPEYKDDDLVYVDPDARTVIGLVQWSSSGRPKSLPIPPPPAVSSTEQTKRGRAPKNKYYPWGTYRSMKRLYKLEGAPHKQEASQLIDEALEKALKEPFWD